MKLIRRVIYRLRRRRVEAELQEEIEAHRAMVQARLEQAGMSARDAASASRRTLGNMTVAREQAGDVWQFASLDRWIGDARYALRLLNRQRTFTVAAILTLGVGIGASTAVFSVVEAELWKPLPFADAERLAVAYLIRPSDPRAVERLSGHDVQVWQRESRSFETLSAYASGARRVLRQMNRAPELVRTRPVTANFFTALDWQPALGTVFSAAAPALPCPVVLTHDGWQRLFDGDRSVIGRSVVLDDDACVVTGVLPAGSRAEFIADPDLFIPLDMSSAAMRDAAAGDLTVLGRLRDGVSLADAAGDLRGLLAASNTAVSAATDAANRATVRVESLRAFFLGFNWRPLYFFLGAALFLLMLSCANVANLLLARALRRQQEFALRAALGGGRAALLRQLLVEGLALVVPGTAAGLLLAAWTAAGLASWLPANYLSRPQAIGIDARVAAFAVATGTLTALVFALAPAFFSRVRLSAALIPAARALGGSALQRRARHALVIVEVAIAFVLVFGAGLFVTSFHRLTHQPLGFDPEQRLAVSMTLTGDAYRDRHEILRFAERARAAAAAVPGVMSAAIATTSPLGGGVSVPFTVGGGLPADAPGHHRRVLARAVTPELFDALAIRLVAGRGLTLEDVQGAPRVAVINQVLARRIFPDADPVGKEIVLAANPAAAWVQRGPVRIVGIAGDIKNVGMNEVDFNAVYLPFAQHPSPTLQVVVRSSLPLTEVTRPVREAVQSIDPALPIAAVISFPQRVRDAVRGDRFNLVLIATFALVAALLAAVGLYATMAYATEQRTPEFGLRMALGAQARQILWLAGSEAMRLGAAGILLGLALSLTLARLLGDALYLVQGEHEGLIYGITTTDPRTLVLTSLALAVLSALAGLIPALEASRVEAAGVLRDS